MADLWRSSSDQWIGSEVKLREGILETFDSNIVARECSGISNNSEGPRLIVRNSELGTHKEAQHHRHGEYFSRQSLDFCNAMLPNTSPHVKWPPVSARKTPYAATTPWSQDCLMLGFISQLESKWPTLGAAKARNQRLGVPWRHSWHIFMAVLSVAGWPESHLSNHIKFDLLFHLVGV